MIHVLLGVQCCVIRVTRVSVSSQQTASEIREIEFRTSRDVVIQSICPSASRDRTIIGITRTYYVPLLLLLLHNIDGAAKSATYPQAREESCRSLAECIRVAPLSLVFRRTRLMLYSGCIRSDNLKMRVQLVAHASRDTDGSRVRVLATEVLWNGVLADETAVLLSVERPTILAYTYLHTL